MVVSQVRRPAKVVNELSLAHNNLEHGVALYRQHIRYLSPLFGQDFPGMHPAVGCLVYDAWTLWMLGYANQALCRGQEALAFARALAHPLSVATVLILFSMLQQFGDQGAAAYEQTEDGLALATHHDFVLLVALGLMARGGALVCQRQDIEGILQISQGLEAHRTTGAKVIEPYFLSLLAVAHGRVGQPEAGLRIVADALAIVEQTQECWWEAELWRIKGVLILQQLQISRSDETKVKGRKPDNSAANL